MLQYLENNSKIHSYTKDNSGVYLAVNPEFIAFAGMQTSNDVLGRNDQEMLWAHAANHIMQHDAAVIKSATSQIFIEKPILKGRLHVRRCFKSPLLGRSGKVIGIVGFSLPIASNSLIPLSKQQTACLQQLALGLSAKQSAQVLGLSPKTVEHYLDAIKIKLNCKSRADLILQAVARGLVQPD